MADKEKAILVTVAKLVAEQLELHKKLALLAEEIDRLLSGGPSVGMRMKHTEIMFGQWWSSLYLGKYHGNGVLKPEERPALKRIVLAYANSDDLDRRIGEYFHDKEEFYVRARHPFNLLERALNRYTPLAHEHTLLETPAPADCTHTPRCQSDVTHTARKLRDTGAAAIPPTQARLRNVRARA